MEKSFGAYQLGEPLGALPFGELVAATHPARSESLAVLLLDAKLSGDHRFRGLVRLEMARVGGVRQPGIARMVEITEQSGVLAVVYERPTDSTPLAARLAHGAALDPTATHVLIRRLAEVLDAAHGRRIVHGLLGPDSVLVGDDGAAALVGLGLLAAVEEAGLRQHIVQRADSSSIAPEQTSGKLAVTTADGYALAVLAQRSLGDTAATDHATLRRQLSREPAQRFPNCVAFATALSASIDADGAQTTADSHASTGAPSTGQLTPDAPPPSYAAPPASPSYAMPPVSPPSYAAPPVRPPAASPPPISAAAPISPPSEPASPAPLVSPETTSPAEPLPWSATPPAPTTPPATEQIPWTMPLAAELPSTPTSSASELPSAPPAYAQPPAQTAPGQQEAQPASRPSAGRLPSWLRDTIDPPNALGQRPTSGPQAATRPAGSPGRPMPAPRDPRTGDDRSRWRSTHAEPLTFTRSRPTPAMLAFQQARSQTDLGTTLVLAITSRVPALDRLTDQYAPDGKLGPVPLGVAVAGALAVILLLLQQPVLAAILGMLVLGLYVMPKVLTKMVASEQPPPEAVRVTGTISLRQRTVGMNLDIFEVDIADGQPLSVPPSAYRRLASLGTPVTIERPTMYGPEQVTVAHELHDVTLTYLVPGRHLLDVRDASGTVIHRHPDYAGEPGDRVSLDAPSASLGTIGSQHTSMFERPDPTPTWKPTPYGHRIVLPMPPALATELQAAFKKAATNAALINGVPLVVLIGSAIFADFGFFALIFAGVIFIMIGGARLMRAITLRKAYQAESIMQVAARMSLRQVERSGSKGSKSQHYFMRLDDGTELKLQRTLFEKLARLGRPLEMGERPGIWERLTQSEETVHVYDLEGSTVTYEPSSELLLEILDAAGNTLYRDSAITPRSIETAPPKPAAS